jgi:hypothetical protein
MVFEFAACERGLFVTSAHVAPVGTAMPAVCWVETNSIPMSLAVAV